VAEEICTRFGVLSAGRLIAEGERDVLLEQSKLKQGTLEDIYIALTSKV
jgi:ABC-type multidrug transport system ATPase subunit